MALNQALGPIPTGHPFLIRADYRRKEHATGRPTVGQAVDRAVFKETFGVDPSSKPEDVEGTVPYKRYCADERQPARSTPK
jgi:hypothetical protein